MHHREFAAYGSACQDAGITFVPLAMEALGASATQLQTHFPPFVICSEFLQHLFQRLAISLWRGNACFCMFILCSCALSFISFQFFLSCSSLVFVFTFFHPSNTILLNFEPSRASENDDVSAGYGSSGAKTSAISVIPIITPHFKFNLLVQSEAAMELMQSQSNNVA